MGLAAASHFIVNVGSRFSQTPCRAAKYFICCQNQYWDTDPFTIFSVTEAGPSAFANIRENYYYVFVACSFFFLVVAYFYFPETKHKTLEEIAAAFGDKVVLLTETELAAEDEALGHKVDEMRVERAVEDGRG
ncbi:hypothetical protein PV10_07916 [Exophiala mesophila]|uniref:Major facilitator superfamily (MFS) profile domain-containing protein n=1 Tax=Exophiala mesophila TaxID=212818 RepID=A0A0D1ZUZ4_EXOME|nr:uncharacterized protein PV10_07916 [Exophiala mesophila]KIV90633.1 hypothetical protein PV10_07916 [Exophiala mesophila]